MNTTYQFKTQTILQHGQSVHEHFKKIINAFDTQDYSKYQIPQNLRHYWPKIKKKLYHFDLLKQYHLYHDCGKPYCLHVDVDGRQHFKNHALVSYDVYTKIFSDDTIAKFIRYDMMFHSGTPEEIDVFIKEHDKRFLLSLWTTSLAEIYSNSEMFAADNQKSFHKKYDKLMGILPKIMG